MIIMDEKLQTTLNKIVRLCSQNPEFDSAKKTLAKALDECVLCELKYFMEHYLDAFSKNLDEISL